MFTVNYLFLNWAPRHEGVLGSGVIAPCILDFGIMWRWVISFTSRPLYPQGRSPSYPLGRRVGGPQSWSGRGGEEKDSQPLQGLEPPIIQPIAHRYTTELSRILTAYLIQDNFHSCVCISTEPRTLEKLRNYRWCGSPMELKSVR
jgi:hypothetical protein